MKLKVNSVSVIITEPETIVSHAVNTHYCYFEFDETWGEYEKKVVFKKRNGIKKEVLLTDNACAIPWEVLETRGFLKIGVYGVCGDKRRPTLWSENILISEGTSEGEESKEPTPSIYEQIVDIMTDTKAIAQSVRDDADAGKFNGEGGGDIDLSNYVQKPTTANSVIYDDKHLNAGFILVNEKTDGTEAPQAYRFGRYMTGGTFPCGTPTQPYHSANKDYVDNRFNIINTIFAQSGIVKKYKQPITQEYNERVTADGLNVLDGSKAILKKVVGSTVACTNLFNPSEVQQKGKGYTYNAETDEFNIVNAIDYFYGHANKELYIVNGKKGQQYTFSAWVKNGTCTNFRFSFVYSDGTYENTQGLDSTDEYEYRTITSDASKTLIRISVNYGTNGSAYFKNARLNEGTADLGYQPYFTGLKSASFGGIETTNADGTETSTLDFPKTDTPLGTTIDFETKKIKNYGIEFVFNGTEKVNYYPNGGNSIMFSGLGGADVNPVGVCTDGILGKELVKTQWRINFGNIYWYTVLDTLGFTNAWADKSNPTDEEKTQAIDDFKAYLAQRYADGNPVTIRYISATLQSETDFTADNEYTAYKGGTEKVLDNDNAEVVENTLTQDYIFVAEVE